MNTWLITAALFIAGLAPCGAICLRGDPMDRLVGLLMAGNLVTLALVLLAEGFHRAPFQDLALTMALLSFAGGLVFARFLERWL